MKLVEERREVEILDEADICVLGGGTTGALAAIRAARLGARVVLVEKEECFGGNATASMVCCWHTLLDFNFEQQIIGGITQEILGRLDKRDALRYHDPTRGEKTSRMQRITSYVFNPQELKIELDEMLAESGVVCYLHTSFCAPYLEDGHLTAIFVESKGGRQAIKARFFIDATGDGDLCYRLGIPCYERDNKQPSTTSALVFGYQGISDPKDTLRQHLEEYDLPCLGWDTTYTGASPEVSLLCKTNVTYGCLDARSLTQSELEGRRQMRAIMDILRKYGGCERQPALLSLSSRIGIREGQIVKGLYTLTKDDVLRGHTFEDAVVNGSYPVDIHHADKPGCTFYYMNGMTEYERDGCPHEVGWWRMETGPAPAYWQMPYRTMVVDNFQNVLVCGRAMDADREAFAALRVMVNLNQSGEAAGVAAWLCVNNDCGSHSIDVKHLRALLADGGSIMI